MRLREAVSRDAEAVSCCVQAAYGVYVERIGRRPAPMDEDYAGLIGKGIVTVAEDDGAIVGVLVSRETQDGFLLENIAVHPARQRTGLGRELLRACT